MSHKKFCTLFIIISVLTVNVSYATTGKVGSMAKLDSDNIILKYDKPIKNVYVVFEVDGDHKDLDISLFIQALELELYRQGFRILDTIEKADLVLSLKIKKINKEYWAGLPTQFGNQRRVICLSVETTYQTKRGQWNKEFIAHKGYWTYTGDAYYRNTAKYDLARAIVNPLHNYRKEKDFINAAGEGDIIAVIKFMDENININADNDLGYTALIAASKNGHIEVVQFLISSKANVNTKDQEGWSALIHTAYNGDQDTTILLLNNGAHINAEDKDKNTPLNWAVLEGHKTIVLLLLSHNARIGNALGLAKQKGNKELEEMLSLHDTEEKSKSDYDCSYLSGLIKSESKERIQYLIENDLMVVDPEDGRCKDAMVSAARKGNKQIIDSFLTKGLDVNAEADRGEAPLIEAAAEGHKEVVEMLTSNGADLDSFGSSALASAAMNGKKDVVEYLLSRTVDINAQSKSGLNIGETPLGEAARGGRKEMIELLLSQGAEINLKNKDGKTPLMTAALEGKTEIVNLLLSSGADINQKDKNGNTVLDLVSKARMHDNIINIDYREVADMLKREQHKKHDGRKTLKSGK